MKVLKIGFVGTRTDQPEAMADFFERVLGLRPTHSGDDMWAFRLPDGGIAEVFGPSHNDHYPTGPVVEFLVEDVEAAAEELRTAGVPICSVPNMRTTWGWPGSSSGRPTGTSTASSRVSTHGLRDRAAGA